jgi:hypothetical protein
MNFRVQIIFNFNSLWKNFAEKMINKKNVYFNEAYPGDLIYYVDFHNPRYINILDIVSLVLTEIAHNNQ